MSGDPEQEYFADGMVEEIITALSCIRRLFVIARNSSFTYKGRAVDAKRIGRELGVRYMLEGSVRKGGNRVRMTAQLIDATNAPHVWADRHDRDLSDIFAVHGLPELGLVGLSRPRDLEPTQTGKTVAAGCLGVLGLLFVLAAAYWRHEVWHICAIQ
jgi:adenylate cyclase